MQTASCLSLCAIVLCCCTYSATHDVSETDSDSTTPSQSLTTDAIVKTLTVYYDDIQVSSYKHHTACKQQMYTALLLDSVVQISSYQWFMCATGS
jgi:hypothetical protein